MLLCAYFCMHVCVIVCMCAWVRVCLCAGSCVHACLDYGFFFCPEGFSLPLFSFIAASWGGAVLMTLGTHFPILNFKNKI